MTIKNKLRLNVGLLFSLILLLGAVGIYYIHALKSATDKILVANYQTLEYSVGMLASLDTLHQESTLQFEKYLQKQESNITEKGEGETTQKVRANFTLLTSDLTQQHLKSQIREDLRAIMSMNMTAIKNKSTLAQNKARTATYWIAITGTLCFLIAFSLLINLPSTIANPIKELSTSFRKIADRNYAERVHFTENSEFGDLARTFNVMAEKLEEYNNSNLAKLMLEKKRIEALITNMRDPVICLDHNNQLIFINKEALKIAGIEYSRESGKNLNTVAQSNDLLRSLLNPESLVKTGDTETLKIFYDNKESHFDKSVIPIQITPTAEKESIEAGKLIILRNVTAYKELDAAKTNFLSTVSHEFKTPLSSINLGIQLLRNEKTGTLNPEQEKLLHGIREDADRLLAITGELLKMTQLESGHIQLNIASSQIAEIVQYALDATRAQVQQKNIQLEISMPSSLPDVWVDREKTAWVLVNLISNAVRYSPLQSTIHLSVLEEEKEIRLEVSDQGPGIAPDYIPRIFERYFRVPGTNTEGSGLGLAISKDFIEAQGGKIGVISTPEQGSTFYITLKTETT